jgi:CBS domain-containing protein
MVATLKPFLSLTANDLMSRELVLIPQEMSLRRAAQWLSQDHISGAPVVDAEGRCIGVLSATDFMRWAEKEHQAPPAAQASPASVYSAWQVMAVETLPTDAVSTYMTANPVMVAPHTPISDLARFMIDAHIHRVIVVDKERRPIGLVSSTDILAAVAHAVARR